MLIQLEAGRHINTDDHTLEELKEFKRAMDDAIDLINHQIELAKLDRSQGKMIKDDLWLQKAEYALTRKRRASQRLSEELGERRRQENVVNRNISEYFMDVCKVKLSVEQFNEILVEANRVKGADAKRVGL